MTGALQAGRIRCTCAQEGAAGLCAQPLMLQEGACRPQLPLCSGPLYIAKCRCTQSRLCRRRCSPDNSFDVGSCARGAGNAGCYCTLTLRPAHRLGHLHSSSMHPATLSKSMVLMDA